MTSQILDRHSIHLELQRTHGQQGHILGSYLTNVMHTAMLMCGERMKDSKFYAQ